MKLLKILFLAVIFATGFINAEAQTADEIINKYVEAIGGKDKVSEIKTVYMEGNIDMMNNLAPSVTYIVNGKGVKNEVDFNGTKMITCYTDKGGWTINPMAGQTTATPVPEDVLKTGQLGLDATGPLFDYASKGNKVEFVGKENGTYHLKVVTPTNVESHFYIDTASYYISKTVTPISANGQQIEMSAENSDFKKTNNGVIMPYSVKLDFVGTGLVITTTAKIIEVNKEIDESIFEMPKN